MADIKIDSYKFSISWARIFPKRRFGEVNLAGINYYSNLINALLFKGIQPFVTLSQFDFPQELEDRYGGWLSPPSQEDFQHYAEVCFRSFGDTVKHWVTFNEPNLSVTFGYVRGKFPPNRCSVPFGNCSEGDSEKEPFVAAHNIILSHAAAVHIYRTKYQNEQGGKIGFVLPCFWFEPFSNSTEDKLAAERALSFTIDWFLYPILFGTYPEEMEKALGMTLPRFFRNDKEKLKNGLDSIGSITTQVTMPETASLHFVNLEKEAQDQKVYIRKLHRKMVFPGRTWYGELNDPINTQEEYLNDVSRIKYMEGHLNYVLAAIRKGADVRGYFAWSLLDNFEWLSDFEVKFGLYYVDFTTLKRTPKLSANWYKQLISKHKAHSIAQENNRQKKEFKDNTKIRRSGPELSF